MKTVLSVFIVLYTLMPCRNLYSLSIMNPVPRINFPANTETFDDAFFIKTGFAPVTSQDFMQAFNLELGCKFNDYCAKFVTQHGSEFFLDVGNSLEDFFLAGIWGTTSRDYPKQYFNMNSILFGYFKNYDRIFYSANIGLGYLTGIFRGHYLFGRYGPYGNQNGNFYSEENIASLCVPVEISFGTYVNFLGFSLSYRTIISSYYPINTFQFNFIFFIF